MTGRDRSMEEIDLLESGRSSENFGRYSSYKTRSRAVGKVRRRKRFYELWLLRAAETNYRKKSLAILSLRESASPCFR